MFLSGNGAGKLSFPVPKKMVKMKIKREFIEVNGIIFDFEEYKEEVRLLKEYTKIDMKEYFGKFDFCLIKEKTKSGLMELRFYNKRMDLEVKVEFLRKGRGKFV